MSELYDEALDEVRRLRERDRPPSQDLEVRVRRLECERDEAFAKVRTAQVDNEELKMKLEVPNPLLEIVVTLKKCPNHSTKNIFSSIIIA